MNFKSNINENFKFFVERKSGRVILSFLSLISVFLILKTSSEPIADFLKNTCIEKILCQFSTGNDVIFNIANGFFVSVIFYIIVVYMPENRKRKDMEPFVKNMCEDLIFSSYSLIEKIIKESQLDYNYKSLKKDEFIEVCKIVNPQVGKYKFYSSHLGIFEHHLGYQLYRDWERVSAKISEILLLPNVDSGLLNRLYILQNNFLKYISRDLAESEKRGIETLHSFADSLYDFYISTKNLRDYYVLYSKVEFSNDPWK